MAPPRKISSKQLEVMIDFLEQNKGMCLGANSTAASTTTNVLNTVRRAWITLAKLLNGVPGGYVKTPDGWRKYWVDLRHTCKKKANDARRFEESPNGGPSKFAPINNLEMRVLALSGRNCIQVKSKQIKELENMLADDNPDSQPIGWHSPETVKPEPLPVHKTCSSTKTSEAPNEYKSGTPPPRWAMELEERRIATEERMAVALESIASVMRLQADTLISVAGNFQELNNGIQEAVAHLQRLNPANSNGCDIKDHVFL